MGEIVQSGPQPYPAPPPGPRPQRPRPPEIRRTSHGLHLALTVVLGLLTFGIGLLVWPIVWLIVHSVNDKNNYKEQDRYHREMQWYQGAYMAWQEQYYAHYGRYAPDIC